MNKKDKMPPATVWKRKSPYDPEKYIKNVHVKQPSSNLEVKTVNIPSPEQKHKQPVTNSISSHFTHPESIPIRNFKQSEQLTSHYNVHKERYVANGKPELYYNNNLSSESTEKYNSSLYNKPQTKHMLSTGVFKNAYTGDSYETFENHLPPPNTTKGHIPAHQLQQVQPKLVHLQGGFNHHNPPPRRKEQLGHIFNPISKRGGSNVWGPQLYEQEIRKQTTEFASRGMYNNRHGSYAVEPSMHGEKPHGYIGYVPRNQFRPYIPATQELSLQDRSQGQQELPVDTTKREQHSGKVFNRKAPPVMVDRKPYADTSLNGVQAVTEIPIISDNVGPQGENVQLYITPAGLENGRRRSNIVGDPDRQNRIALEQRTPLPLNVPHETTVTIIDPNVKSKANPLRQTRQASGPTQSSTGNTIVSEFKVKPTSDSKSLPTTAPNVLNNIGSWLIEDTTLKPTQKEHLTTHPNNVLPISKAGILMHNTQSKDTQRVGHTLPSRPANPVNDAPVIITDFGIRDTQRVGHTLPSRPANPVTNAPLMITDFDIRDSLKVATMENPFRQSNPAYVKASPSAKIFSDVRNTNHRPDYPIFSHHQGVEGHSTAPSVVHSQHITTMQHRGVQKQPYVTQKQQISDGVGNQAKQNIGIHHINNTRVPFVLIGNTNTITPIGTHRLFGQMRSNKKEVEGATIELIED